METRTVYGEVVADRKHTIWVGYPVKDEKLARKLLRKLRWLEIKNSFSDPRRRAVFSIVKLEGVYAFTRTQLDGLDQFDLWCMSEDQIKGYNKVNDTNYTRPDRRDMFDGLMFSDSFIND